MEKIQFINEKDEIYCFEVVGVQSKGLVEGRNNIAVGTIATMHGNVRIALLNSVFNRFSDWAKCAAAMKCVGVSPFEFVGKLLKIFIEDAKLRKMDKLEGVRVAFWSLANTSLFKSVGFKEFDSRSHVYSHLSSFWFSQAREELPRIVRLRRSFYAEGPGRDLIESDKQVEFQIPDELLERLVHKFES